MLNGGNIVATIPVTDLEVSLPVLGLREGPQFGDW